MIRRLVRALSIGATLAILVGWFLVLRPQALGGPATYVVVRGSSMLPLYENGDFVVTEWSHAYAIGEVVAYRVPAGEVGDGHVVIHRIVGGDAANGFVLQGDNNRFVDPWTPRPADIVGTAWIQVPGFGRVIALVQQPVIAAALAMSVAITIMLARPPSRPSNRPPTREGRPVPAA